MQKLISDLQASNIGEIRTNESLAPYTTWKIGGPADVLDYSSLQRAGCCCYPVSLSRAVFLGLLLDEVPICLLRIKEFEALLLSSARRWIHCALKAQWSYAGGSYSFIKLSVLAAKEGLTGLEFASGIPGSVGGAVYMNAGAHGSDVSRILKQAEVILDTGELVVMQAEDLKYAYRHSILHTLPGIVTEAVFELQAGDRNEIAGAMAAYRDRRLRTQPLQLACAGSVFRNPEGGFAAKLIEDAGLKGKRVGGAEISMLHANFIVNTGDATAEDVLTLINEVQQIVEKVYGIKLVPEVLVMGER